MKDKNYNIEFIVGNLYWKDKEGRYLGCNQNTVKFLNLKSCEDIIGKTDKDFFPPHIANLLTENDRKVLQSEKPITEEETMPNAEGEMVHFLTQKEPLRDGFNNIIGVISVSIDITEYAFFKNFLLQNTTGNLFWKDINGKYLGCNEYCAKLLGYSAPEELIGKDDYELWGNKNIPLYTNTVKIDQEIIHTGIEQTIEEKGLNKQGDEAFYISKKVPLRNSHGDIIGILGTSIDITRIKQVELAKSEFLRNMSHDIMTPFTGILGISKLLYEDETDSEKKLNLGHLNQSAERLLQFFKQILDIAQLGSQPVKFTEFDILEIVKEVVEMLTAVAKLKRLQLSYSCLSHLVTTDRTRVSRILLNLVSNAIKYTEQGYVFIEVKCNSELCIKVKDSGIGIPSNKLDVIFQKFQRLEDSSKGNQYRGIGIGLYMVQEYANDIGATIKVESEVGKGSTFIFTQEL